ncbi:MAG: hypothetical protein UY65_C0013G0008 [Parcubacteria group bacterium GW2011_GWA2_51_12]|nr:MAG: hypothetical protein UY65_C0013G0008 [Parcubacteria group bacterium GW2011_GWA2_51_12]
MIQKYSLVLIGLVIFALVGTWFYREKGDSPSHYSYQKDRSAYTGILNPADFEFIDERVYGMIVSHHFYVERLISQSFLSIQTQKPGRIVIIGPDHFGASKYDISVSKLPYETPFGTLQPDEEIIERLEKVGVFRDEDAFVHEHSISALVGSIKAVFPETKIVPLILDRNIYFGKLEQLAAVLDEILPDDSLVVASVDFSHHLNRFASDFHDLKSIATIQSFDYESIKNLEIDSPPSIFTLLKYLELRGAQRMIYKNTNQAYISGNLGSEDVTSYVFANFVRGGSPGGKAIARLMYPAGFSDFEGVMGVEGNFLRGFDERIEYGEALKQSLNLSDPEVAEIDYLVGQLLDDSGQSRYHIFPFRATDSGTALLEYDGAVKVCEEILKARDSQDYCWFNNPE